MDYQNDRDQNVYVVDSNLVEEYTKYFSFVKEGNIYEDQCYGFKICFSKWGNTMNPNDFLECWLTDPTF